MSIEYIKLSLSLKERLIFLFTGIIDKRYLVTIQPKVNNTFINTIEEKELNSIERQSEKVDIPFFNLDESKVKTNL